jgi:uncharacterized membrane-anchored protein
MFNTFGFGRSLMAAVLALSCASVVHAQEPAAQQVTPEQIEASLKYQTGKITLPGSLATLNLPASFRYLGPADSERVLVEGWGNPPGNETLGMIVPANTSVLSDAGWGVVITYDKDGHVKDDDADDINYDELLADLKEGTNEANKERKALGYGAMTLVGWAEKPSYDKASHKMYWAKELRTEGNATSGLNYNIRVLGREGVLVLNAVASMAQIDEIRKEMKLVTAATDFTPGNRYADYNAATDKTAEYGLAALVAGGVATKLGLFGKLFALLLAFKKFIIIGIGFAAMWLYRVFTGRREAKVNLEK